MIYTYSTEEKAINAIPKFCQKKEQDCFVYRVVYTSGEEYSLRTRDGILNEESELIVYKFYLPINHCFCEGDKQTARDNAMREANVWAERLSKNITIDSHYKFERNYKIFSHYTLEPCST